MALFNNFPYSNTEEINLDYTLNKLNELYSTGETLYAQLQTWKTATDTANEAWKSDLISDINDWQTNVTNSLEQWKSSVDSEVANNLTNLSNQITTELIQAKADLRAEVTDLASAAAASASDAAASQSAAAQSAQTAVNSAGAAAASAAEIETSAEQIEINKDDITDLKSATTDVVKGFTLSASDFEKGGINDSGNNDSYRNACRCRNIAIVSYPFDIIYSVKSSVSNCVFSIHIYDSNGTETSNTGWQTTYTVTAGTLFRMTMDGKYQSSSETISVEDLLAKLDVNMLNLADLQTQVNNINISSVFVNAKAFGATGDGVTDDTQAIQNALESIKTSGGTVYLPSGTYYINSLLFDTDNTDRATSLHIYSNCRLLMDNNAVILRGSGTQRIIATHNESDATEYNGCSNIIFEGGTYDADATLSENSDSILLSHGDNIVIKNAKFVGTKGSWHSIECNSSRNVLIDGCVMESDATNGLIDIDAANNSGNLGVDDHTVCYNIQIQNCTITTKWRPAIQNHTAYAQHNIRIHDNVFYMQAGTDTRAIISFADSVTKVDVYNNTFYNTNSGGNGYPFTMTTADLTSTYHDNRAEGFTASYPENNCTGYNNMLNGTFVQ